MVEDNDRKHAVETLAELIKDIRVAMLTTMTPGDLLRSRPMYVASIQLDGSLWFFTDERAAKVDEIDANQQVNVSFADSEQDRYVSISGAAEMVRDDGKGKVLWTPELSRWFPEGPADPHLALLRVDVEEADYWDSQTSAMRRLGGFVRFLVKGDGSTASEKHHAHIEWGERETQIES